MKAEPENTAQQEAENNEEIALEADLTVEEANLQIDQAISGRKENVRKYIRWVRSKNPEASPAQLKELLGQHYVTAITAAGAAITVGSIAADIGISLIPGGGAVKGVKAVAKQAALGAVKAGAQHASTKMLPAGDEQLQFEITALYMLALADVHGVELNKQQAHELVYRATCMADESSESKSSEATQGIVSELQAGAMDSVQDSLSTKQQSIVTYGTEGIASGVARFTFGREVVEVADQMFTDTPEVFPQHLSIPDASEVEEKEPNKALAALEDAAKTAGNKMSTGSAVAAKGVRSAAAKVSSPFRSVDLDGDGEPDEAQALTAAKNIKGSVSGAVKSVGSKLPKPFKKKD